VLGPENMNFNFEYDANIEYKSAFIEISNPFIRITMSFDRSHIKDLASLLFRNVGGLKVGQCCGQPVFWAANQSDNLYIMIGDNEFRNINLTIDKESVLQLQRILS
jgi:hypothetical protein